MGSPCENSNPPGPIGDETHGRLRSYPRQHAEAAIASPEVQAETIRKHPAAVGLPEPVMLEREKGTGTICAKHPTGRSGKWCLSPFSRAGFGTRKVGKRSEWDMQQLAYIAEIAERLGKGEDVLLVVADFWGRGIKDHRGLPWGQVQAKPGKGTGNGFEWFWRATRWFHRMKRADKLPPPYCDLAHTIADPSGSRFKSTQHAREWRKRGKSGRGFWGLLLLVLAANDG